MNKYDELILNYLKTQDDLHFRLGDTLDIKTSIALAVIIFLTTQSVGILSAPAIPLHWRNAQIASVIFLATAVGAALYELWPRKYWKMPDPDKFIGWTEELKAFYNQEENSGAESRTVEQIQKAEGIEKTKNRIMHNAALNDFKLRTMGWAFYLTLFPLFLNFLTIIALSLRWRF